MRSPATQEAVPALHSQRRALQLLAGLQRHVQHFPSLHAGQCPQFAGWEWVWPGLSPVNQPAGTHAACKSSAEHLVAHSLH